MQTMQNTTVGTHNTALGTYAMFSNVDSSKNVAIGFNSLRMLEPASAVNSFNVAAGYESGKLITTGIQNTLIGANAGDGISIGAYNVALGYNSLSAVNAGSKSVAIGSGALSVQQPSFGIALCRPTSGSAVVTLASGNGRIADSLIGTIVTGTGVAGGTVTIIARSGNTQFTMSANATSGDGSATQTFTFTGGVDSNNTAVGYFAGNDLTTGALNTIMGAGAGKSITSGSSNIIIGGGCGDGITTGSDNVAIGTSALGEGNGGEARNVAIGTKALFNVDFNGSTNNVAIGYEAGLSIEAGVNNTIIGAECGDALTTGDNNIIIGYNAALGAVDRDNCIVIGKDAIGGGDNTITMGTDAITRAKIFGKLTSVFQETVTGLGGGLDGVELGQVQIGSYNSEVITTIYLDLGQGGATDIVSSGTAGDVIGENDAAAAFATQVTTAKNGVIYKAELICMETPVGGDTDINVTLHASSLAEDAAGESGGHVIVNGGAQAIGRHSTGDAAAIEAAAGGGNDYLYLTHGGTTAGTYTAGKFLIRLFGVTADGL